MRENIEFLIRKIIAYRMRWLRLFRLTRFRSLLWFFFMENVFPFWYNRLERYRL